MSSKCLCENTRCVSLIFFLVLLVQINTIRYESFRRLNLLVDFRTLIFYTNASDQSVATNKVHVIFINSYSGRIYYYGDKWKLLDRLIILVPVRIVIFYMNAVFQPSSKYTFQMLIEKSRVFHTCVAVIQPTYEFMQLISKKQK